MPGREEGEGGGGRRGAVVGEEHTAIVERSRGGGAAVKEVAVRWDEDDGRAPEHGGGEEEEDAGADLTIPHSDEGHGGDEFSFSPNSFCTSTSNGGERIESFPPGGGQVSVDVTASWNTLGRRNALGLPEALWAH